MAGLQLCFLGTSAGHPTKFRCAQAPTLAPVSALSADRTVRVKASLEM